MTCHLPLDCIAIHKHLINIGLRVSFYPFLRCILSFLNIAPSQLSPNGWAQLVGFFLLWESEDYDGEFSSKILRSIYRPLLIGGPTSRQKGYYPLSHVF